MKKQFFLIILICLVLFGALISGCGKQAAPGTNASAPSVSSVFPTSGATSVSRNTYLTATFSQSMDATSITTSTFKCSSSSGFVTGTVSYSASSKTAIFTPSADLSASTQYSGIVYTGAKNTSGIGLNADYTWSFTAGSVTDSTGPQVLSTVPTDGATAVATTTTISVIFDEAIDPTTINTSTFTVTSSAGSVTGTATYSVSAKTAYFTPGASLDYSTIYTALLTTGIKDLAGNNLNSSSRNTSGAQYSWSFTTNKSWTQVTTAASFTGRQHHASVSFDDKVWVIGGWDGTNYLNDVWYTSDGATWTRATASADFDARCYHAATVFDDGSGEKMWVIGGQGLIAGSYTSLWRKDAWYSTDGITWTRATNNAGFGERTYHKVLVHNSKMWVIGGFDGGSSGTKKSDVWSSTDGITWTQVTASANFSDRVYFDAVVYDSKMWVIAGFDGNRLKDVWSSTDGITWTQAAAAAAFPEKSDFVALNYDGYMWVLGGYSSSSYDNDVWRSTDGITWTQQTFVNTFSPRIFHSGAVNDSKMWIMAGTTSTATESNDVWTYP
ncbi:MAG: Ig-like domain-containing protein [Candidatus Saganbacteria bacterium]|nr:Ig-like domain-containing protein [Candidatus Saganbacteria bacterium]